MSQEIKIPEDKVVIEFSAHTLDTYQKCEQLYKYVVVDRLAPSIKAEPLDKGALMHHILETYYTEIKNGKDRNKAHIEAMERGKDEGPKTDLDTGSIHDVISTFQRYHIRYQHDAWIPLGIEEPFAKVIFETDELMMLIRGKIDLRVEAPPAPGVIIVDHKTGEQNFKTIPISNQFEIYAIATGATSIIRNFVGFQKDPDLNFARKPVPYNKEYLEEQKRQLIYWGLKMYETEMAGEYPMRKASCFRCAFSDVCQTPPNGRDFKLKVNYRVQDKYDLFGTDKKGK